jgi:hypothetical protein
MRSAGNFHPEWGYLAPAPSFVRTIRIALVATAIGAVAGAAVVVSLVQRPGSNDDNAIAAHALLTRAPVISSPAVAPHIAAPAVATVMPTQSQMHQPQQSVAMTAPPAPASAAAPAPATTPSPNVVASTDKPDQADGVRPPLPLPAPTDATVATNAPVGEAARVPAEADEAVAPDTAAEPRMPAKKSIAKRHRYEPYRRQETRGRWHDNGGFGPLFRLFSFRTGSPYSSN